MQAGKIFRKQLKGVFMPHKKSLFASDLLAQAKKMAHWERQSRRINKKAQQYEDLEDMVICSNLVNAYYTGCLMRQNLLGVPLSDEEKTKIMDTVLDDMAKMTARKHSLLR